MLLVRYKTESAQDHWQYWLFTGNVSSEAARRAIENKTTLNLICFEVPTDDNWLVTIE